MIWLFVALIIANFYPLLDGGWKQIWRVLTNQKASMAVKDGQGGNVSPSSPSVLGKEDIVVDEEKARRVG